MIHVPFVYEDHQECYKQLQFFETSLLLLPSSLDSYLGATSRPWKQTVSSTLHGLPLTPFDALPVF